MGTSLILLVVVGMGAIKYMDLNMTLIIEEYIIVALDSRDTYSKLTS